MSWGKNLRPFLPANYGNKPIAVFRLNLTRMRLNFTILITGLPLEAGDIIRIEDEIMEILSIEGDILTVARGTQDTVIVTHRAGLEIFTSRRVSLVEFFTQTNWNPQIGKFGIWALVECNFDDLYHRNGGCASYWVEYCHLSE